MSDDERTSAYAAIQKAVALKDNVTEAERDYIEALATRYNGDPSTPRDPLDEAWVNAMRDVHNKYPVVMTWRPELVRHCLTAWALINMPLRPAILMRNVTSTRDW